MQAKPKMTINYGFSMQQENKILLIKVALSHKTSPIIFKQLCCLPAESSVRTLSKCIHN